MRTGLITLILTLTVVCCQARCNGRRLSVFPSGSEIRQNPVFVITGYMNSQGVINSLNKKYPVYLKSGDKRVKLRVKEINVGQFSLTQAILVPETDLEAGLEYVLHIDGLDREDELGRYNPQTRTKEEIKYRISAGKDEQIPYLTGEPEELGKRYAEYASGPSACVVFSLPVKDVSELLVRAIVKNKDGRKTVFYIEPADNKILLGHEMCAGAFKFNDGDNYEVAFSFMDASGNIVPGGSFIPFTKPTKANSANIE